MGEDVEVWDGSRIWERVLGFGFVLLVLVEFFNWLDVFENIFRILF